MSPFECYQQYLALKRHFTSDYNYFKYRGKVNVSKEAFEGRRDKMLFNVLAKQKDPFKLMVVTLAHKPDAYITDIISEKSKRLLLETEKYQQSFEYSFKRELKKHYEANTGMNNDISEAVKVIDGQYPLVVKDWIAGRISLDTLSVIEKICNGCKNWSKQLHDPLWTDINRQLLKYRPFMSIDTTKYKKIITDIYND